MTDRLTLKRTYPDAEIYTTVYHHPVHGPIAVGYIAERTGAPHRSERWTWAIRITTLAPVYSHPEDMKLPSNQRRWITRSAISFEGYALDKEKAIAAWKETWPTFRDTRTDEEWRKVKEDQDRSSRWGR